MFKAKVISPYSIPNSCNSAARENKSGQTKGGSMKTSHAVAWYVVAVLVLVTSSFVVALLLNGPPPDGDISYSLANEAWEEMVVVHTIISTIISMVVGWMAAMVILVRAFVLAIKGKVGDGYYPRLYRCGVNGVTALVRVEDFNGAEPRNRFTRDGRLVLRVVPRTMTFSKFRHRNMTGTMDDLAQFTKGCVVEEAIFFVPHASDVFMTYEEQEEQFPYVRLDEAYNLVWRGCRTAASAA